MVELKKRMLISLSSACDVKKTEKYKNTKRHTEPVDWTLTRVGRYMWIQPVNNMVDTAIAAACIHTVNMIQTVYTHTKSRTDSIHRTNWNSRYKNRTDSRYGNILYKQYAARTCQFIIRVCLLFAPDYYLRTSS